MRLIKVKVANYRRLAEQQEADPETEQPIKKRPEMDVDGEVVCIVGPNAAGKSSFIDALVHLNHDGPFEPTEGTRVPHKPPLTPFVEARYVLDDVDKNELSVIKEAKDAQQFLVQKYGNDGRVYEVLPNPPPNLEPRQRVAERVGKLIESEWASDVSEAEGGAGLSAKEQTPNITKSALQVLRVENEELDEDEVEHLVQLRDRLAAIINNQHAAPEVKSPAKSFHRLIPDLAELIEIERRGSPHSQSIEILRSRRPRFLKFEADARKLDPVYDLNDEVTRNSAVENLLALAGTTWEEVAGIVQDGDKGRKNSWLDRVNAELKTAITEAWGQSPLTVMFDIDANNLTILMEMTAEDYIPIDEQSDGLRQFVALRAFIAKEKTSKPIVLIDEADAHLHYDAQADLVTVFEEQGEAAQIIYTTHSAGCLPRDLGVGIRAIAPIQGERDGKLITTDHSEIVNKFWVADRGFSPLLIAMGASVFAFSAAQRALVTEGMSDAILLPTLIREAVKVDRLQYQVVPSFAEARPREIPEFELLASRVAYAADGDGGGEAHVQKLKDNGVLGKQIVFLGGQGSGLSLEDLLVKDLYVDAVNEELNRWHAGVRYPREELPDQGRSKAVEDYLADQRDANGEPIKVSKAAIAQRVLDRRWDRSVDPPKKRVLVPNRKHQILKDLHSEAAAIFDKATKDLIEGGEAA